MLDDKLIKEENILLEIVAKLKCGLYMWGVKDDAVCKSACVCGKKEEKADVEVFISIIFVIFLS